MSQATITRTWAKKGKGWIPAFELSLPVRDVDIRRSGRAKSIVSKFVGDLVASPVRPTRMKAPFSKADKLGLDFKNSMLELTWKKTPEEGPEMWRVDYELAMPLITGGSLLRARLGGTIVGPIGQRSYDYPIYPDGKLDTPFRDGAHLKWDAELLGIDGWVVYGERRQCLT